MSVTFTKLFASITESTVWCEPDTTRLCWITMLAMADARGRVWGSIPGLANRARVSVDAARTAINTFLSPDPDSRSSNNEGRRIEVIDGGWRLINHEKYRAIRDHETIKESKRTWAAKNRLKTMGVGRNVEKVVDSRSLSNEVDRIRANAEADTEADTEKEESTPSAVDESFQIFWKAYPRKTGKGEAERSWAKAKINGKLEIVLKAIEVQSKSSQWTKDGGQFIPLPSTWLNQRRWEDEVFEKPVSGGRKFSC